MSDIKTALIQYNTAMDALEVAEKSVQDALLLIKSASTSSTIQVEGQFFQVRARAGKMYLCELNGRPRGRPKGSVNKKTRQRKEAAELAAAARAARAEDVEGALESDEPTESIESDELDAPDDDDDDEMPEFEPAEPPYGEIMAAVDVIDDIDAVNPFANDVATATGVHLKELEPLIINVDIVAV